MAQSRRQFLRSCATYTGMALAGGGATEAIAGTDLAAAPVAHGGELAPCAFYALPLGSVRPLGWLKRQLRVQADGLSGHLPQTWADVGPDSGWLGGHGESGERGPYYLDGLVPLAYLLDDDRLKSIAQPFLEWTLASQSADGMFGPPRDGDWWPRMVMLKALAQYQEASGDPRVIPFMQRYLRYQHAALGSRPLTSWGKFRWQDEVLSIAWLYRRTADGFLLELAKLVQSQGHDWQAEYRSFPFRQPVTWAVIHAHGDDGSGEFALSSHGVNNGMGVKTGPVWYLFSGDLSDRNNVFTALSALDRYHGLPNGMFSCDEHLGGTDPVHGSELCTVVETMFSLEQALSITGDASLADRLELIAFNPLPGAFTDDMWAHQYNQQPNQVECSVHTKPWTTDGPESNLYGLAPHFGCCTANYHQGWPKFTASAFMKTQDEGIVAAVYAPVELRTTLRGRHLSIIEETDYPFRELVQFRFALEQPLHFPFLVRVPYWCTSPVIQINGKTQQLTSSPGFVRLERTWKSGDTVEVRLPMTPRLLEGAQNSLSVYQGPLLFSLPIAESWLKLRDRGLTADWQVYPASQWNYAISRERAQLHADYRTIGLQPFSRAGTGVAVRAAAVKVPAWRAQDSTANPIPLVAEDSIVPLAEQITLEPYASAKLRISAFPRLPSSFESKLSS